LEPLQQRAARRPVVDDPGEHDAVRGDGEAAAGDQRADMHERDERANAAWLA
jgi:hypothetical protein